MSLQHSSSTSPGRAPRATPASRQSRFDATSLASSRARRLGKRQVRKLIACEQFWVADGVIWRVSNIYRKDRQALLVTPRPGGAYSRLVTFGQLANSYRLVEVEGD